MPMTPQQILDEALQMPLGDRAAIAERIFASLEPESLTDEWSREVDRRLAEIEDGSAILIDGESVFDEVHRKIAQINSSK